MTWIRTIPLPEGSEELREAMEGQKALYPQEYAVPIHPSEGGGSQIVASHSLIPQALHHAFSTFGVADVSRPAAGTAATRDDRHHGLGHQSVCLLNRVARRVSASRHTG